MRPEWVDGLSPDNTERAAERAGEALRAGGVVVFPTETVYGVGVVASRAGAVERLRKLKGRDADKPFTVHIADAADVARFVDVPPHSLIDRLVRKTMPGPVTLVCAAEPETIAAKLDALGLCGDDGQWLYKDGTIGLRCPDHDLARAVLRGAGGAVVASSANRAGEPPPRDARTAAQSIGEDVDIVLDGGECRYARASTVVRVAGERLDVLREGVIEARYLEKLTRTTLLFVCTGNTCRSPMAQAIARHELKRRLGDGAASVVVTSAGAFTGGGSPMTPEAAAALRELGVEPGGHVSRGLTYEMVREADAVFCMTPSHRDAVVGIAPAAAARVELLDPSGKSVPDPIGAPLQTYVECARKMRSLIVERLDSMGVGGKTTAHTTENDGGTV